MQTEHGPTTGERELSETGTDQAGGSEVQKEKETALLRLGGRKDEFPDVEEGRCNHSFLQQNQTLILRLQERTSLVR